MKSEKDGDRYKREGRGDCLSGRKRGRRRETEGEKDIAQSLPLNYLGRYQTGCFTCAE